jgi:hypothetical protein
MVPRQPTKQYGSLVDEVGVELDIPEAGMRSLQRGVGEVESR